MAPSSVNASTLKPDIQTQPHYISSNIDRDTIDDNGGSSCDHSYTSICDPTCSLCGYTRTVTHQYTYEYLSKVTCYATCSLCLTSTQKDHNWVTTTTDATSSSSASKTTTCTQCGYSYTTFWGSPDTDDVTFPTFNGTYQNVDNSALHAYAWSVFKLIRSICIPLAIISLASCGYKFLGTIFFGSYNAPSATEKAQKQFVWTVLAVLFIALLPGIFDYADAFFKVHAWRPS